MRPLLPVLLVFLSSCVAVGDGAVAASRTEYNVALRRSDDEQLLLNLVRLRYGDRILFLEASALTTQFKFRASADATSDFGSQVPEAFGLDAGVIFEENPTVSYTPLQGADYVQRVLSPVPLEALFLLDNSGWSSERALRVLVEEMNGVANARGANGPTPALAPDYEPFRRVTQLLRVLELRGLTYGAREGDGLAIVFEPEALGTPEHAELCAMLELDPTRREVYVNASAGSRSRRADVLNIRFRSISGAMAFLSHAVEVPERDVAAGRVATTVDAEGRPFDWQRVTDGLMRIRSSETRPAEAAVAVRHRGSWFFIDDRDIDSKSTFAMLGQVLALQAGDVQSTLPVLTIPVGG